MHMWHDWFIREMTRSYMTHWINSYVIVPFQDWNCASPMTSYLTWKWAYSHTYHDSFICVTPHRPLFLRDTYTHTLHVCVGCVTHRNEYWWHVCVTWVTHDDESCHTHEWVTLGIWIGHSTHMMSHVTHRNTSRHTEYPVMVHVRMRHATHRDQARHIYECNILMQMSLILLHMSRISM